MTSLFRFVVSFAVLEMCVVGEQAKFVACGTKKHWLRRDCVWCGRCVSCDRTPASRLAFVPRALLRGERWDELFLQSDDVARHLQLLRSRVSMLSSAYAQFLDESEAAQRQHYFGTVGHQPQCLWYCCWSLSFHSPIQQESVDAVFTLGRSRSFCQFWYCCLVTIGATSWHVVHVSYLFLFVALILVHFRWEKVLCVVRFCRLSFMCFFFFRF